MIVQRPAPLIRNDGKRTPHRGHPVFVTQYRIADRCRACRSRWRGIPTGQVLTEDDGYYVVEMMIR